MQYSQKYTLVAFFEPIEVGTEFNMADWPVHMTLADVFAANLDNGIEQGLTGLLEKQSPVTLRAKGDSVLGTTKVVLIEEDDELHNLHNQIVNLLEVNGAKFNNPEFTRSGFLPHSTIQKSGRLHEGDRLDIKFISLIDMFPGGDWQQREVLMNFELGGVEH